MRTPALLRFRKFGLLALLALAQPASATITLTFSSDAVGRASRFSNSAGTAGVNGMRWGIIVSTSDSTFASSYDGGFDINTSGFLSSGGVATDDYYVAHPQWSTSPADAVTRNTDSTPTIGGTDPGGDGSITGMASAPYTNLSVGRPFQIVWFESGSAVGDNYGTLGNTGSTAPFVLPADGGSSDFTAFFAGTAADPIRGAFSLFRSPVAAQPEIIVHQPSGTNVPDNGSVNFGATAVNTNVDRIFTVKNAGTTNLNITSYSIVGTDASSFSIQNIPATTLVPTASTTVTVRYTPTTYGSKTATLRILSNDADEGIYDITLDGTTPADVHFDKLSFQVDENVMGGNATIAFARTGDTSGSSTVYFSTVNGTGTAGATGGATGTTTGTDFQTQTRVAVVFGPGDAYATASIPINPETPTNVVESNQTFTVRLLTAAPDAPIGAIIGTPGTASVTIVDPTSETLDTVAPPVPTITTPTEKALVGVPTDGTFEVKGTATDLKGVQYVEYRMLPATGSPGSFTQLGDGYYGAVGATSTTFSIPVIPVTGKNRIEVRSRDFRTTPEPNTSPSVIREFTVTRPLPIGLAGTGTGTITAGYSPTSFREVGKSYTVVATPTAASGIDPGSIFVGWTLGGVDVAQGNAVLDSTKLSRIGTVQANMVKQSLTFIFREGMTLTATFERSAYPAKSGTYNGLVKTTTIEDGISPTTTEGYFNAEVGTSGAFSGKLTIDGLVLNVNGFFDAARVARFGTTRTDEIVVARTNKPSLRVKLTGPNTAPYQITGTVTQTAFQQSKVVGVSAVSSDRAYYGKQVLPGKILSKSATETTIQLASADGRTVGEVVTGTGILAGSAISAVNLPDQIVINKVATAALNATPSLTFARDVPNAYLTINGAVKSNGAFTAVLPPKYPYYEQEGEFVPTGYSLGGGSYFDPGPNTEFRNGDAVRFVGGPLPTGFNTNDTFFVSNRDPNTGRFQIADGSSNTISFGESSLDGTIVRDPGDSQVEDDADYRWQDYPQGYGYGTVSVTPAGLVTFSTTLADGTPAAGSSTISEPDTDNVVPADQHDGIVALFVPLYTKLGFLSGYVTLKDAPESDMLATDLQWMRPAITTSHHFPAGWPTVISVGLKAATYEYGVSTNVLLAENGAAIETVDPEGDGNAALVFGDGQLTESLVKNAFLSAANSATTVVKVPDNDPTFTLKVAHKTGVFDGTFYHTDDTIPTFKGIIYQKGAKAGGYGYFLTVQPTTITYTGEGGWVELIGEQ